MSNRRFSLVSLILLVSFVAAVMAWLVSQRAYQEQSSQFESLKVEHANLKDETGQIDSDDPDLIYVRSLRSDVPNVFRFRVAVPIDTNVHLDCRYDVNGESVALRSPSRQQDFFWSISSISPGALPISESHRISELTIYLQKNSGLWTVKSNAGSSFAISTHFGVLRDTRLQWLDQSAGPQQANVGNPLGNPVVHSSSKSEEVVLQRITGEMNSLQRSISFVLSPSQQASTGMEVQVRPLSK